VRSNQREDLSALELKGYTYLVHVFSHRALLIASVCLSGYLLPYRSMKNISSAAERQEVIWVLHA